MPTGTPPPSVALLWNCISLRVWLERGRGPANGGHRGGRVAVAIAAGLCLGGSGAPSGANGSYGRGSVLAC